MYRSESKKKKRSLSNKKVDTVIKQAIQYSDTSNIHEFAVKTLIRSHVKRQQTKQATLLYEKYLKKYKNLQIKLT